MAFLPRTFLVDLDSHEIHAVTRVVDIYGRGIGDRSMCKSYKYALYCASGSWSAAGIAGDT